MLGFGGSLAAVVGKNECVQKNVGGRQTKRRERKVRSTETLGGRKTTNANLRV